MEKKTKKKKFNCKGAISIFLVIVLVPMITCSSLFVDASRVKSARGLISSAGDLTLNTVLSQYDVDLNEFYGLMASAQDMDDVLAAAEAYFTSCIKSQGIDTTDTTKWVNGIKNVFLESGDISDLLGIDLESGSNVKVEPVTNGSLTNSALVKTQVVEFMKYRSPINSVVDLYDKFKNSSKELENTTKTSDLVDKKQDYYEAQGDVADKAYKIYQKIVEYDRLGIDGSDLQEMQTFINSLEGKYKECHIKMVKDLYNTQGLSASDINSCKTISSQYTHKKQYDSASANTIGGLINSLMRAYDQFIKARDEFNNNVKSWPTSGNSYYDIQYWAHCCKNSTYFKNVKSKHDNLRQSYSNLRDAVEHAAEGALDENYTSTYKSTTNLDVVKGTTKTIQSWWDFLDPKVKSAAKSVTDKGTKYNTAVAKVKTVSNSLDRIDTSDTNAKLADMYNTLNGYYTRYKKAFDLLNDIVKGLGELKDLVTTADQKFDSWEDKADEYSSDIELAKSDQKEIKEVKQNYEKLKESDIDDYIEHINNVKSAIGTVKEGAKKIKYNGQSIIDKKIDGYSSFKKNSIVTESQIPIYVTDLNNYANSTFSFSTEGVNISSLNFTKNNDPQIANRKYVVFDWMLKQGFDEPKDEKKEGEYNGYKDSAEENIKNAETISLDDVASKNDISTLSGLPSGTSAELDNGEVTSDIKAVSNFVSSLFTNFSSTISQAGVDVRDALFTVDYITSMLTWQTFEFEAKYNMLDKNQKKAITYANASTYYSAKSDAWKSEDVTQKYNKTLTNKLRNSASTNWSYCNEVEYIMYGKSIDDSKSKLNGSIYMIRFALNLPAIFSTFYNEKGVDSLSTFAAAVNTATHGIVPAGLVKVVICLGLTALESARDLKTLRSGLPVIFIKKNADDLFCTNWEFIAGKKPKSTDITTATTLSYSDYMKLMLFLKLLGSGSYDIYGRLADVIQTNMSKCVLKDDNYSLSKSQVYYSITAQLKVKPLMLDSSYVKSYMSDASSKMDSWNSISYSATRGY